MEKWNDYFLKFYEAQQKKWIKNYESILSACNTFFEKAFPNVARGGGMISKLKRSP